MFANFVVHLTDSLLAFTPEVLTSPMTFPAARFAEREESLEVGALKSRLNRRLRRARAPSPSPIRRRHRDSPSLLPAHPVPPHPPPSSKIPEPSEPNPSKSNLANAQDSELRDPTPSRSSSLSNPSQPVVFNDKAKCTSFCRHRRSQLN
ncbi:hypothetical protein SCHPADRAFT_98507 [Schizopora paradoxa]|uniref:Uncharacterized protein n=1 Tax=Schizopora paradoxa TaxID=27342 RepID=A0A0H2S372_9AGAM|nr:hypothetical protein SCHPADRAFT_98507 [Schizopora paradoxa]